VPTTKPTAATAGNSLTTTALAIAMLFTP
jgi:hypothetical protein